MPKVTILPAGASAEVEPGELLLDAGEKAGIDMEAGRKFLAAFHLGLRRIISMEFPAMSPGPMSG